MSAGTSLLAIQQSGELNSNVITSVLDEATPAKRGDVTKMADMLPVVPSTNADYLTAILGTNGGLSQPYALEGAMGGIALPPVEYLRFGRKLHFREGMTFGERELDNLKSMTNLNEKMMIKEMVGVATKEILQRFENRRAWMFTQLATTNDLSIDENGVNFSMPGTNTVLPREWMLDLNDSAATGFCDVRDLPTPYAYTPALWSGETRDVIGTIMAVKRWAREGLGVELVNMYIDGFTAEWISSDATFQSILKLHKLDHLTNEFTATTGPLKGLNIEVVSPTVDITTKLGADLAISSGTTMYVESVKDMAANDIVEIVYEDGNGKMERNYGYISSTTAPNTITLGAAMNSGLSNTAKAGSRVVVHKRLIPKGYVIFSTDRTPDNLVRYTSVPSSAANLENPKPGWFGDVEYSPYKSEPWIRIFGGINGSVDVLRPGAFVTLRVCA